MTSDAPREAVDPLVRQNWADLSERLVKVLRLSTVPVAISFADSPPPGVDRFDAPMPSAPEDHGNCSVGSVTHGLLAPSEVVDHRDVAELIGAGWVGPRPSRSAA